MKRYKVTLWINSKWINTIVLANGQSQARAMIASMYPGATNLTLTEIGG